VRLPDGRDDHARSGRASVIWVVLGTIAIVAATITVGVVADRKWGLLPRPKELAAAGARPKLPGHAAGEAPATAITAGPMAIETLRRSQRCRACNTPLDVLADDRVHYDDRDLIVLQFRCPRCATKLSLYVAPATA
jgi:hypothetical protein